MIKNLFRFTILFIFILSLSTLVYARPFSPPSIVIKCDIEDSIFQQNVTCLNDNCSVNVSRTYVNNLDLNLENLNLQYLRMIYMSINDSGDPPRYSGDAIIMELGSDFFENVSFHSQFPQTLHPQIFQYLDSICVENITEIKPIFSQEIQNWVLNKDNITDLPTYSQEGNLIFVPYSSDRESKLIEERTIYNSCYYASYKKVGNWLVVTTVSNYCVPEDNTKNILPYLAIFLILIGSIIIFVVFKIIKKS